MNKKPSTTTTASDAGKGTPKRTISTNSKQRKKKKAPAVPVIEPAEAWAHLLDWEEQHDTDAWQFNEAADVWLIKNMYDAEAVPKDVFAFLVEGYLQVKPEDEKQAIRNCATRCVSRYKKFEKQVKDGTWQEPPASGTTDTDDDDDDEDAVWNRIDEHEKRKRYKRARKTLDVVKI